MKKDFYITLLLFALPLFGVSQNQAQIINGDTIKFGESTQSFNKNSLSCEFELWLASSITYKRRLSKRFSVGATIGGGFVKIFPIHNGASLYIEGVKPEGIKVGPVFSYNIASFLSYEISPQLITFIPKFFLVDEYDFISNKFRAFGVRQSFFLSIKRVELGTSFFIGRGNIGRHENNQGFVYFNKNFAYSSLIILRIPIQYNN